MPHLYIVGQILSPSFAGLTQVRKYSGIFFLESGKIEFLKEGQVKLKRKKETKSHLE